MTTSFLRGCDSPRRDHSWTSGSEPPTQRCSGPDPARFAAPSNSDRTSVRTVNTNSRSITTLLSNNCSLGRRTHPEPNNFRESEHLYPVVCHTLQTHVRSSLRREKPSQLDRSQQDRSQQDQSQHNQSQQSVATQRKGGRHGRAQTHRAAAGHS